jgi:hypothetical protein
VRNAFDSIKQLTEVSEELFSEGGSADLFRRKITVEIENINLLLDGLLGYLLITPPVRKSGKVCVFIEEALKEKEVSLREKQAEVIKRFEEDLPDPAISDDELRYVLSSVLDYAVGSLLTNGDLGFIVKSTPPKEKETQRKIRILLFFSPDRGVAKALTLILQLVEQVVRRNQGAMKLEENREKGKIFIWLVFPVENWSFF